MNDNKLIVYHGTIGGPVSKYSYKDFKVKFPNGGFSELPAVTANLNNWTEYVDAYANVQFFVLVTTLTKTGVTIRVMNGYKSSDISPYLTWCAIGKSID